MTALELKPCPFCGGGAKLSNGFVSCEVCVCAMPLGFGFFDGEAVGFDDDDAAITKWNRRADLAQTAQVLEICGKCMGSGYGGHPDSGQLCADCNGSGGVEPQPISKSADLHDPRDEVIKGLVNALVTVNGITEASYPQVTSAGDVAEIQKVARAALAAAKVVQP